MYAGKEAVYPQFFLQLGEEPPAFVVSTIALCRFHGIALKKSSLQADGTSEKLRPTLTKGEPAD